MRHFREEDSSREALAEWVAKWIDAGKRTAQFSAAEVQADLNAAPFAETDDAPTRSDSSGDRTLAMQVNDPLGASGAQPIPPLSSHSGETLYPGSLAVHGEGDSTQPDLETMAIPMVSSSNEDASPQKVEEHSTDPVRLPTRSEIQRAVDAVATMPIPLDQLEAPPAKKPDFEEILSKKAMARLSSKPAAVETNGLTMEPPELARDPTVVGPLTSLESHPTPIDPFAVERAPDDDAFAPMKIGVVEALSGSPPVLVQSVESSIGRRPISDANVRLLYVVAALASVVIGLAMALLIRHC
jgi:hypothetical protein